MNKIIVIVGPTGIGKTKLSIELAKKLSGEVINGDSMQVYRQLDIGTAKVTDEEKCGIPHHLFDICDVNDLYTVKDYQNDCRRVIDEVFSRGNIPIVVGGTGLYIKSAFYNYIFNEEEKVSKYDNLSNDDLYELICRNTNEEVHINNRKRMLRILEKYENNSLDNGNSENELLYPNVYFIGLTIERDKLYEIVNRRVDKMIDTGLVDEARALYDKNVYSKAVMTGIGYKELYKYFDGEISFEDAIELIKKNTRHYIKRQYTWFNNKMDINWFNVNLDDFSVTVDDVLNFIRS